MNYNQTDIDKPVDQLFQAIFQLQIIEEYDDITGQLKKEIVKLFNSIEEKKGKKRIRQIDYHPNGLCEWKSKDQQILLPTWESATDVVGKKKNYNALKRFNIMWYIQFMDYLKKPIRLGTDKFNYEELKAFKEKYDVLSEEEKTLLSETGQDYDHLLMKEYLKITNLLNQTRDGYYSLFQYNYRIDKLECQELVVGFLSNDQLETLKLVYDRDYKSQYRDYKSQYLAIREVESLLNSFKASAVNETSEMVILDFSDLVISKQELLDENEDEYYQRISNRELDYTFKFDTLEESFFAIVEKFKAVEDETLQKLFKKLNIF